LVDQIANGRVLSGVAATGRPGDEAAEGVRDL
jgi:hypothetical protein